MRIFIILCIQLRPRKRGLEAGVTPRNMPFKFFSLIVDGGEMIAGSFEMLPWADYVGPCLGPNYGPLIGLLGSYRAY